MYQTLKTGSIVEDEMEIKLIPIGDMVLAQISSGRIRGTLIVTGSVEKDELSELGEVIFDLMERLNVETFDVDENEVGN